MNIKSNHPLMSCDSLILKMLNEGYRKAAIARHIVEQKLNCQYTFESVNSYVKAIAKQFENGELEESKAESVLPTTKPTFNYTENANTASLEAYGRIKTLDQLLASANVDTKIWIVERFTVNKWEVGAKQPDGKISTEELFQVKAWLKKNVVAFDADKIRRELVEDAIVHAPAYIPIPRKKTDGDKYLLELSVYDMHIGKLSWDEETGDNYDSAISSTLFIKSIEELVNRCSGYQIDRIVFPIGNDILHVDSKNNTTFAGTPQDVDTRYHKMFRIARRACVQAIERLRLIAPVDVQIVPGNHDTERCFYLGDSLQGWFSHCADVSINNSPSMRKYYKYGKCMLLFTHGNEEKVADLPLLMAVEEKQMWADTAYREVHMGHLHTKSSISYRDTLENKGVRVRIIPSLCAADAWHTAKGYVGNLRSAEAFIWHKDRGCEAQLSYCL